MDWGVFDLMGWHVAYLTVGYIGFVGWLYFFHSKLRERTRAEKSDWYAQLLKIVQVWCLVHVTFFHLMGHYLMRVSRKISPSTVFFPLLAIFLCFFSLFHREKRRLAFGITYAPTTTLLFMNSLVVASGLSLHLAACEIVVSIPLLGLCFCPSYEKPVPTIFHLCILGVMFIAGDYYYKKHHGFNVLRAILWSDSYHLKDHDVASVSEPRGEPMVEWYSLLAANTGLKLVFGAALRFLTFDFRTIEKSISPKAFEFGPATKSKAAPSTNGTASRSSSASRKSVTGKASAAKPTAVDKTRSSTNRAPSNGRKSTQPPPSRSSRAGSLSHDAIERQHCGVGLDGEEDVWFDFAADVGDGFNSTYEIARLLAQPTLAVSTSDPSLMKSLKNLARDRWKRMTLVGKSLRLKLATMNSTPKHSPGTPPEETREFPRSASPPQSPEHAPIPALDLPRGSFLILGGDLAYPSPEEEVWRDRFLGPYNDALPRSLPLREHERRRCPRMQPSSSDPDRGIIKELVIKEGSGSDHNVDDQAVLSAPILFAIPGNHDWFDGIGTYRSLILSKSWLGGWHMPQKSSYFAIALPCDWHIFGLDNGLFEDIDLDQLQYFLSYVEQRLTVTSSVILITHEPVWINDHHNVLEGDQHTQQRVHKLEIALGNRLRTRIAGDMLCGLLRPIAGDIHNYSRYSPTKLTDHIQSPSSPRTPRPESVKSSTKDVSAFTLAQSPSRQNLDGMDEDDEANYPQLIVSGGGGAFLCGSGVSPKEVACFNKRYTRRNWYPLGAKTLSLFRRVFGFRLVNWKFDIIGGMLYFLLVYSVLPMNPIVHSCSDIRNAADFIQQVIVTTWDLLFALFTDTIVSCTVALVCIGSYLFLISQRVAAWKRLPSGFIFGLLHVITATFLLSLMHHAISIMIDHGMVKSNHEQWRSSVLEELVESYQDFIAVLDRSRHGYMGFIADPTLRVAQWLSSCTWLTQPLSFVVRTLDVTEGFAYLRLQVTAPNLGFGEFIHGSTRLERLLYYAHFLWFYWLLATPAMAALLGLFLWYCVTVLDCGYDPAYSAFRIEDYKNFLRLRLNRKDGTIDIFVIGVDHVPRHWEADPKHIAEKEKYEKLVEGTDESIPPPHLWEYPSRWIPMKPNNVQQHIPWMYKGPRLVEKITLKRTPKPLPDE